MSPVQLNENERKRAHGNGVHGFGAGIWSADENMI